MSEMPVDDAQITRKNFTAPDHTGSQDMILVQRDTGFAVKDLKRPPRSRPIVSGLDFW